MEAPGRQNTPSPQQDDIDTLTPASPDDADDVCFPMIPEVSGDALLPPYLRSSADTLSSASTATTQTQPEPHSSLSSSSSSYTSSYPAPQTTLVNTHRCYLCTPPRSSQGKHKDKEKLIDVRSKLHGHTTKRVDFYLKIQPMDDLRTHVSDFILIPFEASRLELHPEPVHYVRAVTDIYTPLSPFNRPYLKTIDISPYASWLYHNCHFHETNYPGIEVTNNGLVEFSIWNKEGSQVQLASFDVSTEFSIRTTLQPGQRTYMKFINFALRSRNPLTAGDDPSLSGGTTHTNFEVEICLLNHKERLFLINNIRLAFNFNSKFEVSAREALHARASDRPVRLDQEICYARNRKTVNVGKWMSYSGQDTAIGCRRCLVHTENGYVLHPRIGRRLPNRGPDVKEITEKLKEGKQAERGEQDHRRLNEQLRFLHEKNKEWRTKMMGKQRRGEMNHRKTNNSREQNMSLINNKYQH